MDNLNESSERTVLKTITPLWAQQLLQMKGRNRNLVPRVIAQYAAAMSDGRWRVNGETIKISSSGIVLDGQHRLQACVKSNTAFMTYVVYGIDPDTFDTIDIGRKRTPGDILGIEGCKNSAAVAGALRWVEAIRRRTLQLTNVRFTPDEIRLMWIADTNIEVCVARASLVKKLLAPSPAGALYYLFEKRDKIETERFFSDLANGADLSASDPVFVLREKLLTLRLQQNQKYNPTSREVIALCIRAWNHRREGQSTKVLRGLVRTDDGRALLPEIA